MKKQGKETSQKSNRANVESRILEARAERRIPIREWAVYNPARDGVRDADLEGEDSG